jgi:hypothetical protein
MLPSDLQTIHRHVVELRDAAAEIQMRDLRRERLPLHGFAPVLIQRKVIYDEFAAIHGQLHRLAPIGLQMHVAIERAAGDLCIEHGGRHAQ